MNDQNEDKSQELLPSDISTENSDDKSKSDENQSGSTERGTQLSEDALKKLPPEVRKVFEVGMSMHRFGPMPNPLAEKLNESHIDKILEFSAKSDERSFQDTAHSRWFTLVYVLISAALFVFLTIFLVGQDKELYKEAIKLFAAFLGGFGGGFGVKTYIDRDK